MEVTTHEMDPRIARIHYQDYKKRVLAHREERSRRLAEAASVSRKALYEARKKKDQLALEDEELMVMYRAMSQGKRVIALGEVFSETGVDDDFVPHMAIARADWQWVYFGSSEFYANGRLRERGPFFASESTRWGHTRQNSLYLPTSFFPSETTQSRLRSQNELCILPVKAMVPTIPPHLRPDKPEKYWLLWEAEWNKTPPEDPILLRRLNLYSFSVVATWDLTPLERSVLCGRPS
jgi:hypothetical protein